MLELKKPEGDSFTANGHRYIIENSLSIERFVAYQKYEIELAWNMGFEGVYKGINSSIDLYNKQRSAESVANLVNLRDSISKLDTKRVTAVELCALFINRENEDRRYISDQLIQDKQKDWETEGIPVDFFLTVAQNLVRGYREVLKSGTSTSLTKEEKK